MKKMLTLLISVGIFFSTLSTDVFADASNDMRAAWVTSVYNMDWPSSSSKGNISYQKSEFIKMLDSLKNMGLNAVFVQVRPKGDALYKSSINPWSDVLTGTQGKDPGYDPLAFMVEEAHKRGMEIHAWLNPYRVTTSGTDLNTLASNHPARLNPSWVLSYNNALFYNPEMPEVKQHISDTVAEIVKNYNIDGIHFDDYFYPDNYPLPEGQGRDGEVANQRRDHVTSMVSKVRSTIKSIKSNVKFGISPAGVWKNKSSDPTGSDTRGNETYYSHFADVRAWIKNGYIDYVVPQLYWTIGNNAADYSKLVKWWSDEVSGTNVKLYIGQGVYKDDVASEIDNQISLNTKYSNIKGSAFFSTSDLISNRAGVADKLKQIYTTSGGSNSNEPEVGGSESDESTNSGTPSVPNVPNVPSVDKTGTVTANSLNVRSGPGTNNKVIASVKKGTVVTILDTQGDWSNVRLSNGTAGWASTQYISVSTSSDNNKPSNPSAPSATKTGTVTANSLNIRSGAGTNNKVVASVKKGTVVTILNAQGDWYNIKLSNGTAGWASTQYINVNNSGNNNVTTNPSTPSTTKTGSVIATSLNVRSGASTSSKVVASVKNGTKVTILDTRNGWHNIKLSNGTVGWVSAQYIK